MKDNEPTICKGLKDCIAKVIPVFGVIILAILTIWFSIINMSNQQLLPELETKITNLETRITVLESGGSQTGGGYYETELGFLKEQTDIYRDFVEQQYINLFTLITIIGSLTVLVMGYVGLSNRAEIKSLMKSQMKEEYESEFNIQFNKQVSNIVGGGRKYTILDTGS